MGGQFAGEVFLGWKVEDRAGYRDIRLDQHDAPRAVKHSQGEAALCASDLIMLELHRVNRAAGEFVILRVRSEDRT